MVSFLMILNRKNITPECKKVRSVQLCFFQLYFFSFRIYWERNLRVQTQSRYCQNCHYNPDSNCRKEPSLGNIAQSAIESKCIELLEQDRTLYAVVYSSTEKKCFTYNCLHTAVLTYVFGHSTYMRTCDTGMKPVSSTVYNMSGVNIYKYVYTYTV